MKGGQTAVARAQAGSSFATVYAGPGLGLVGRLGRPGLGLVGRLGRAGPGLLGRAGPGLLGLLGRAGLAGGPEPAAHPTELRAVAFTQGCVSRGA
ncbi:MAG: hypothetical protein KGP10_06465 [Actinomycetales bacterium]|nr:hypothetical protein [Actinomycetales bacterium]